MFTTTTAELIVYVIVTIIVAVLGSSVLSVLITKWFDRSKTAASVENTEAHTTDIMTQAWERSMKHMATQLEMQQRRIFDLEKKLDAANQRILELQAEIHILESRVGHRRKDDTGV